MVTFITELNGGNFHEFIKDGVVLVDILAEWCGPCKLIAPIVDELSIDYQGKVKIGKLDADLNKEIISELGVRNIPTILIFQNGEIVDKSVGMATKAKLSEILDKYLSTQAN
jgi:thioredoxin 1